MTNGEERGPESPGRPDPADSSEIERLIAENEALRSSLGRRAMWRRVLAALLVVLTSLSVVATTFAIWAHQTLFDTDQFMGTVGVALEEPALYDAVGDRISSQVLGALDLETRVSDALASLDAFISQALLDALEVDQRARDLLARVDRPSLTALAAPIVEGLETRIDSRVDTFFNSEAFTTRLPQLVRRAHEVTIALLRGDLVELPNVYVAEGEVRWNLIPFIAEILRRIADDIRGFFPGIELPEVVSDAVSEGRQQLAEAIGARLPEDFGQLTVMSEQTLSDAQSGVERLDRYVWGLLILSVILVVVTILLSPTRRRTALQIALGVALGITIAAVVVRRVEEGIVAEIVSSDGELATRAMLGGVFSSLRALELIVLLAAIVVAIAAYLAGRPAWVVSANEEYQALTERGPSGSRLDRWVSRHFDLLRLAIIGLAAFALFVVGFGWASVVVIGLLLALSLWWMSEARGRAAGPDGDELQLVEVDARRD